MHNVYSAIIYIILNFILIITELEINLAMANVSRAQQGTFDTVHINSHFVAQHRSVPSADFALS